MERVLLLYKKIGETPFECLERFKSAHLEYAGVSLTYAGRLDPMAEGLLLVLAGDEVYKKEEYTSLSKTYEFEVLWGFQTDTYDALGLIKNADGYFPNDVDIRKALEKLVGKREQVYPLYSSKTVQGKPLFLWAREGKGALVEVPCREIEIFNLSFIRTSEISGVDLKKRILNSIEKVRGDFRQEEIRHDWEKNIDPFKIYRISSFFVDCSSGTYIRSLSQDLGSELGFYAIALHIKRLKIGPYSVDVAGVDRY